MDGFESTILRWVCLFDEFQDTEYSNIKNLVSSTAFKQFVDNVFCLKCSSALSTEDSKVYNTIKANYSEFEVQKYEDLNNEETSVYTCVVVLLHALLKCTNNKFRNQLSEKMDNEEQILVAKFLEATQSSLFTKQNISEALMLISDLKNTSTNVSEVYSNNNTPVKSKSKRRSYLQEFCESPKSQSLIRQEKDKLITKLTEDYKNECEENYKLAENIKCLEVLNTQLSNKLEDKDKILKVLKEEIEELLNPKQIPEYLKEDNDLIIKKLNRDKIDLEMNLNELKQQVVELEKKNKELNGKLEMKTSDYNNLILMFDNIENENMILKTNMKLSEETIQKKDTEITSLKDELINKSITISPSNVSCQETNAMSSNTLFNELSCLKLEEITHDKEKYRHKYKSTKKDLSNTKTHVQELNEKITVLQKKLHDYEIHKDELIDKFSNKIKELQECQNKNKNFESKIKHLKDNINDNEKTIESMCSKLKKKEKQVEILSVEIDSVKKSKTMIELILSKTNTEIEAIHEQNDEKIKNLQSIIVEYKNSEKLSHQNIIDLENNIKNAQDNLANKEHIIIFYEEKMAENYHTVGILEEQLKTMYQEKSILETHLKNLKAEIETQQKMFSDKNREMENCLEYYLDELKDVKNEKTKIEEISCYKQNEIEQQLKLNNYQKDLIETLQSEKCSQQLIISDLNDVLQQKSSENKDLNEKVLKYTLDFNELNDQLNTVLTEKNVIDTNLKLSDMHMKTLNEDFQHQINDMKNLLENQNNLCITKVDKLKDALENKQNDFNEQLVACTKLTETISQLHLEKHELEEKLKSSCQDLNQKQIQYEHITEENNKLKKAVNSTNKQCIDLQNNLKDLSNNILKKEEDIKLLKVHVSECSISKEILEQQVIEVQQTLNNTHIELEHQIQLCNEQKETIIKLNYEIKSVNDKIKSFEESASHNEYKFNLCEGKLYDCSNTIDKLEKKIKKMNDDNSCLELQLNETVTKSINTKQDLTEKLEVSKENLLKIQEKLILEQDGSKIQMEKSNEQIKTISFLKAEKNKLQEETFKLQECLKTNESILKSLQAKVLIHEKNNEELQTSKTNLVSELKELQTSKANLVLELKANQLKLTNLRQEVKQELECMDSKYIELQEKYNKKQVEIDEYISKYNSHMEKITNLTLEKDNLNNKINALESTLLNKDSVIAANQEKMFEYEELHNKIITEKALMETELTQRLEDMETKLSGLQIELNCKQEKNCQQLKVIFDLTSEQDHLINETNKLKECLLEKENTLKFNDIKFIEFKTQLEELQSQKSYLEAELKDTKVQLDNIKQNLTQKLETKNKKIIEVEEQLMKLQEKLEEQNKCSIEQVEKINSLLCEKNNLVNEKNKLNECLVKNELDLASNQNKLQDYNKENKEMEYRNTSLMIELNQLKCELNNLRQESTEEIAKMDVRLMEAQEQLSINQSEMNKQIKLKNDSLENIKQQINDLKNVKVELESILKEERKNFETLNYSFNHIKNKPILDHQHDSLIEVISSADTFIEENGIQLAQVENYDEYSIMERVKKIFEALKVFIMSLKTQVNEQTNTHTNNEYSSNEAYTELLTISKKQQETIEHLETEMSTLKSECNYKMTKVQQKTQEYVTTEYEKKFERKREQMKQFCKDLEAKIHQDYETKLSKYKDKITKDELHIKELGQQLWEVSDKYLRLQQKDRRESTMSLPFEMSTISETTTNFQRYNSFTLPKSSSVGQIRSLVEESTRSYQDNTKRNVPAGIGKKFSLSSGKIFPKEEDEEGEMFNHSCLADLKQGKVRLNDNKKQNNERLSELQARNSLCPPHLRSCYAAETNFLPNTSLVTEEDIKTTANYSDYETENLIPNDRTKKKDRNQTSYKKPGPPTPSKNGGRVSLSNNSKSTLKESKESNTNKRRASSTPNKLFSLFMSKKN